MKSVKERLHRVLVIGATPAGIAATNKLGEMGVPVTLVDPDPDLDRKLAAPEWRLKSGLTLNYALRPGLLRILRNPRIRCVVPGQVTSLKHSPQGFSARLKPLATYIDAERCTLCGRCRDICPVADSVDGGPIHYHGRFSLPGRPVIDKRRQPLCQENCPLGVNVQGYVALTRAGRYREALALIRRDNVLPGICGRVCTHPCELACRRTELDEPLAIRDIKRFLADYEMATGEGSTSATPPVQEPTARPAVSNAATAELAAAVAVIGTGPAGLAAAADLARLGYDVTMFEKEDRPGGLLRYGIGPYRLPRTVLDHEIDAIRRLGVNIRTSHPVDTKSGLEQLRATHAAVVVATGSWTDRKLGVPGEDLVGVSGCLEFLTELYRGRAPDLPESVAVIGDGNAAFDLARALVRLGPRVTLISWFPEELIPADPEELKAAREEGITLIDRTQVIGFTGANGRLQHLHCARTRPGEPDASGIPWPVKIPGEPPFDLEFTRALVAIGQCGTAAFGDNCGLRTNAAGYVDVDECCATGVPTVYAAGDAASGPSSVVRAMASGRRAAAAVHQALTSGRPRGEAKRPKRREPIPQTFPAAVANTWIGPSPFPAPRRSPERELREIGAHVPSLARAKMAERQPAARCDLCAEVALGLTETQVHSESERCLQCGVCSECLECLGVCREPGAIAHHQLPAELIEQAGVVIIADPQAAPSVKGEDVIRAYGTKAVTSDVYAMMLRGFAAAAEALVLLGIDSQRMKGHGLSFAPPDAQLPAQLRIGVFVCRCNDSFGWSDQLSEQVAALPDLPDIEHAEVLAAACTPDASTTILRTVREKGLTRIVLGSCICCPLVFVCSACTDQRSRLKNALFNGTGISRAMVETCNIRGETLRFLKQSPELAFDRFRGLIHRSVGRARKLKSVPAPARPYNFTTAVIGDSEAAARSATTLAEIGMEVFLFGTPGKTLADPLIHPNIHHFGNALVKGLRGTLGNFQVMVENESLEQIFQVGAVIIGEGSRRRIPYMPMSELPPHLVRSAMQSEGLVGVPFFFPGSTAIPGLFLADPQGIGVSQRTKGAAAAILAAAVMPRRPRFNKGYTVAVAAERCRGCGRCRDACPYQAVSFRRNDIGGWFAVVDQALCKGCGNCISVCPSNAADSPYRDRRYLEQMIEEILL